MSGDDGWPNSRGKRILIALSSAIALILPLLVMLVFVFQPDGQFYVGRRGSEFRFPITRGYGQAAFLATIGLFLVLMVGGLWHHTRQSGADFEKTDAAATLPLGEQVRWTGSPTWRSFRGPRVLGAALAILIPFLLVWWIWSIWAGNGLFLSKLFFTAIPSGALFGSVIPGLISGSGYFHSWVSDIFGTIAITERRIVWLTPWKQRIYRELAGAEIEDAYIGCSKGSRGSITVIKRKKNDVEHIYLDGLPHPDAALAALVPLIRPGI